MRNTSEDDTNELQLNAQNFQNLLQQLTILPKNEDSFFLTVTNQIKDINNTAPILNEINKSISEIISNYNNFGINQSGISELDPEQANEICANATKLLDELISFLKKEDILTSDNLIISLENEKNIYIQMHHIVYSLVVSEQTNENLDQESEIPIVKSYPDNIEKIQQTNDTDLDTLLEDPNIKEELEIYTLDSELVDTTLWTESVTEIHQAMGNRQSINNPYDLDELLENIKQDSKELDSEALHATVSNDIKEAKLAIRAELEEKYKIILNIAIQLKNSEISNDLALKLTETKTIISQMYQSLNSLGVDDPVMDKLDEDKSKFATALCKLLHGQIISNQYKQFMSDYENLSTSPSISDVERLNIGKLHGNLVNNIQQYIIEWESNDNLDKLWDSCNSNMNEINRKHQQQIVMQRNERQALKEESLKNVDLNSLIAKADEAIGHKDYTTLVDMKKQLLEQQAYLSKSLEKAMHSVGTIQPLRDTINSVSECLKKINNELGITTPTILARPNNKEKDLGNALPTLPSVRRTI